MTRQFTGRHFLAFGRVIESDIALPLLSEVDQPALSEVKARIIVSTVPKKVPPGLISRDSSLSVTLHRERDRVVVALSHFGWLAYLRKNPATITLHPDSGQTVRQNDFVRLEGRVLGDRVVTNVLPYLPQLWGQWGIHGAYLDTQGGAVMLLASSGAGKSTLSQVLSRDYGWHILDDDTSMVLNSPPKVSFVPMGAEARLRADAAKYLGIDISRLESYSGGKGLLPRPRPRPHQPRADLRAFITLVPEGAHLVSSAELEQPECAALAAMDAMHSIFESMFSLESDLRSTIEDQLRLSAELSRLPHFALRYRKGTHTPEQTAQEIVRALAHNLGLK